MSDRNPYTELGVAEDASFEQIQDAKNRLMREHKDDGAVLESVEAAYDAIIMERLKQRQEGKIKVPERIRFPHRGAQEAPQSPKPSPAGASPSWFQRLLDAPSRDDILIPAAIYILLSAVTLFYEPRQGSILPLLVALGFGACVYLLNRKEKRFGRALAISLAGLIAGIGIGTGLVQTELTAGLEADRFAALTAFFTFWLTGSFLR